MARNISADGETPVYRAIIKFYDDEGGLRFSEYEGPYAKKGSARARVTFWKNYLGHRYTIEGWVEEGTVEWKLVD